jgi:hypothetical protein
VTINHETSTPQTVNGTATVTDPAVVAAGVNGSASVNTAFTGVVANFTDPGGAEPNPSDDPGGLISNHYSATINWGDASSSTGTITQSGGTFTVTGTHTYTAPGSYSVTTTINHEFAGAATANSTIAVTSAQASTSTTVTSSLNPSTVGQAVTFTATVTASGGMTPTGTVQFQIDGVNVGPVITVSSAGTASLTTSALSAGSHSVIANFVGTGGFANSTGGLVGGQLVNAQSAYAASATTVVSSVNPSTLGQPVVFTATVNGGFSGNPSGTVTFFDGFMSLGIVPTTGAGSMTTASLTTSTLSAGSHLITASYSGNGIFKGSKGTLTQNVTGGPQPPAPAGIKVGGIPVDDDSGTITTTQASPNVPAVAPGNSAKPSDNAASELAVSLNSDNSLTADHVAILFASLNGRRNRYTDGDANSDFTVFGF